MSEAKQLFLRYSADGVIAGTDYGQVLNADAGPAKIYVNGLRVATEDDFLFSYNITSSTKKLRSALNRERSNVGRSAYSDRVKMILLASDTPHVINGLVEDLQRFERGTQHDETRWKDVALHACGQLNAISKVMFVSPMELNSATDFIQRARDDGHRIVVVPADLRSSLRDLDDAAGNRIRDLDEYKREWVDSFQFEFVEISDLTPHERRVWDMLSQIFLARGDRPDRIRDVRISETMRPEEHSYREAVGLWKPDTGTIIVKRDQLQSLHKFAGTVIHELAHATSGAPDISAEFEEALTNELGTTVSKSLQTRPK